MKTSSNKKYLIIAGVLFAIFLTNIFASKIVLELDIKSLPFIDYIWEFLILLMSALFFVVAILNEESQLKYKATKTDCI